MKPLLLRLGLACLLTGCGLVRAALPTNVVLCVTGDLPQPLALSLADLDNFTRIVQPARDHDGTDARYEGVALSDLLQRAGLAMRENLRGPALRYGVLVKAADNYAALFAVAELDPDMTDRVVFLADLRNDRFLPPGQGPLRLIVPGEKRHARWVRQVNELEVVRLGGPEEAVWRSPPSVAGTVAIAAAANLSFVLDELNRAFTNTHPAVAVTASLGASGNLFAQLQRGAPFDVFLAADMDFPRRLADAGAAEKDSLFAYARGRLVLWSTRTNVSVTNGLAELRRAGVRRVAIANPETAPYGQAAKAALEHESLWSEVQPRIVIGENIGQTAQFIERGAVDAGLVARSLVVAPRLKDVGAWWPVPDEFHPPILQGAVLTKTGATNAAARAYLGFLRAAAARKLLDRFGYGAPATSPP